MGNEKTIEDYCDEIAYIGAAVCARFHDDDETMVAAAIMQAMATDRQTDAILTLNDTIKQAYGLDEAATETRA